MYYFKFGEIKKASNIFDDFFIYNKFELSST